MSYRRKYDVVLLVGLTELKAQVSWIDSKTVRVHLVLQGIRLLHPVSVCVNIGVREKVYSNIFRSFTLRTEFNS